LKHGKVPRWVSAAMAKTPESPFGPVRQYPVLSDLIERLEVQCALCNRRGRFRVDRLLAEVGDVSVPQAMIEIAKRGGCRRALNPPDIGDISYNEHVCQIRQVRKG
jgi:hypothetical protein